MPKQQNIKPVAEDADSSEYLWGAEAIGAVINRNDRQVYHLHAKGVFGDAVVKVGHKSLLGFRSKIPQALAKFESR
jgi:hypothetical protein